MPDARTPFISLGYMGLSGKGWNGVERFLFQEVCIYSGAGSTSMVYIVYQYIGIMMKHVSQAMIAFNSNDCLSNYS